MPSPEGLDELCLAQLVNHFYARVRRDPLLGPLFNDAVEDWPAHLEKLAAFWSSVMLTTGRYKGQPLPAHRQHLPRLTPDMFTRWLKLWEDSAKACLPPSLGGGLGHRQGASHRGEPANGPVPPLAPHARHPQAASRALTFFFWGLASPAARSFHSISLS